MRSFAETPNAHQLTGAIYAGISTTLKEIMLLQANIHVGMNGLSEQYFSMPFYGGVEFIGAMMMQKFLLGISLGGELFAYQTRLIEGYQQANDDKIHINASDINGRFKNLSLNGDMFAGIYLGYKIGSQFRLTARVQGVIPLKKEETDPKRYTIGKEVPFDMTSTVAYSPGVRAMLGFEWVKELKGEK